MGQWSSVAWVQKLGRAERIVVIVALGLILDALCTYFVPLGATGLISISGSNSGAFLNYQLEGVPGLLRVLAWIVVAVGWATVSIRILRAPSAKPPDSN